MSVVFIGSTIEVRSGSMRGPFLVQGSVVGLWTASRGSAGSGWPHALKLGSSNVALLSTLRLFCKAFGISKFCLIPVKAQERCGESRPSSSCFFEWEYIRIRGFFKLGMLGMSEGVQEHPRTIVCWNQTVPRLRKTCMSMNTQPISTLWKLLPVHNKSPSSYAMSPTVSPTWEKYATVCHVET